MFFSKL